MTKDSKIGWHFPPTNGGRVDGFNDPGIAHFSGSPYSSLAREIIQNSLDAKDIEDRPVHVVFEIGNLSPNDIGSEELSRAVEACRKELKPNDPALPELKRALDVLARNKIPFLRVSDRNTIGLKGQHWRTLVKMQGASSKGELEGAGGSFGIGKYAPFAVSALRTVFYWTHYLEDGNHKEKLQGKCVLMSHEHDGVEAQGTGFYGYKDGCREFTGDIPKQFRLIETDSNPILGTGIQVMGFVESRDWRRSISVSVIENFFYAIGRGQLKVLVEPEDGEGGIFEIDNTTLGSCFEELLTESSKSDEEHDEGIASLREAKCLWEVSGEEESAIEKQDKDFGHCRLWIRVADGLPSRVGFIRQTGMLVTTKQRGLIRFPGFKDFAAICVFEDPAGNEFLRRMENPRHDQFEPDRLPEEDKTKGRRALKRITEWIRDELRKQAGPPEGSRSRMLSELSTYVPDMQPDEPFDENEQQNGDTGEPGFGDRVKLTLKPIRRFTPPILPPDNEEDNDGDSDGDDLGNYGGEVQGGNGGGGGNGGTGVGDLQGGTGGRGGKKPKERRIPITRVRILSVQGSRNCYQLSFQSESDGVARLTLEEAGDSTTIRREDIRAVEEGVSLDNISLTKGQRTKVEITADFPIGGRAWRVGAVTRDE